MKNLFLPLLFCFSVSGSLAQLQPLFSQKISDGLLLDPSLSGYSGGSVIFGIKKQWANVNGSPQYLYFGSHARLGKDKIGVGTNFFLEESNILENYCISIPIAYHLPVTRFSGVSFGLAPDLTRSQINRDKLRVQDYSDPIIQQLDDGFILDFNYGMNFHNQIFQIGVSANRILSLMNYEQAESRPVNGFLTAYANVFFKIRDGKDKLEPSVIYRYQFHAPSQVDASLFYFNSYGFIIGGSYRTGNLIAGHAGFNFRERLILGYSYDMLLGSYGGEMGGSHEVVCRYNFNKQYFEHSDKYKTQPRTSFTTKKKNKK